MGMLALHMPADGVQLFWVYGVHDQRTVGQLAFRRVVGQRQISGVWRDQGIVFTVGIASMARPRVVPRINHHGGPQRIEFDVTMAPHQVVAIFHRTGLVATFPERAGAPITETRVQSHGNRTCASAPICTPSKPGLA